MTADLKRHCQRKIPNTLGGRGAACIDPQKSKDINDAEIRSRRAGKAMAFLRQNHPPRYRSKPTPLKRERTVRKAPISRKGLGGIQEPGAEARQSSINGE